MPSLTPTVIVGTVIAIASTVIGILLTQSDIVISPPVKLALVCTNAALSVLALRLNLDPPATS